MDNIITITNVRENNLEFDLSVTGVDDSNAVARFVIRTEKVNFAFPCGRNGSKWEVNIPAMPQLERTMYPFSIEFIADGYFFEPMVGQVNVVGTADIYITTPKNPTVQPPQPEPTGRPVPEPVVAVVPVPSETTTEGKKPLTTKQLITSAISDQTSSKDEIIRRAIAEAQQEIEAKKPVTAKPKAKKAETKKKEVEKVAVVEAEVESEKDKKVRELLQADSEAHKTFKKPTQISFKKGKVTERH